MGKTRYLHKKIGDIKGKLHVIMGIIICRNHKDLRETKEIKKLWQEYAEKHE